MAINERLIHSAAAASETAADATGNQEDGLMLYLDANDIDSYDGVDGTKWYDITNHEYTPAVDPAENFNTVTYTGNGSTGQSITGVGFQSDVVWIKNRTDSEHHTLFDSLSGADKSNYTNLALGQGINEAFASFDADGFTLDTDHNRQNANGDNYVAWCFKAGGAPTTTNSGGQTPTSGSKMVDGSTVTDAYPTADIYPTKQSVNTKLGFSVTEYTGAGSGKTLPHGLDVPPEMYIIKTTSSGNWWVYTTEGGDFRYLKLNENDLGIDADQYYDRPTAELIEQGQALNSHNVMYAFASKRGVSKVGSYIGTGAAGNKVYTGFQPAWLMIKNTTGGSWLIYDNKRDSSNPRRKVLMSHITNSEYADLTDINFELDGFTIAESGSSNDNTASVKYMYLAFAEEKPDSLVASTEGSIDSNSVSSIALSSTSSVAPTIDGGIRDVFSGSLVVGEQFGFDDTGNSEGTNYFTLTLNEATAFKKFAVHEMYQSTYKYTGTVKVYGSNDNSYFTLIAQTNQTTSVQFNRNETDISDTTEYLYYKFDFYGNTRGTYQGAFRIELITDLDVTPELHLDAGDTDSYDPNTGGSTWSDLTAGNHDVALTSMNADQHDEELGGWFEFDGGSDYGVISGSSDLYMSGAGFTIEAWVNRDSNAEGYIISSKDTTNYPYALTWHPSLGYYGWLAGSSFAGNSAVNGGSTSVGNGVGKWDHVVIVQDGTDRKNRIYVNGTHVGAASSAQSGSHSSTADVHIGTYHNFTNKWDGKIGQIRIYDKSLTADEIMQNYRFTKNDYPNGGDGTIHGASFIPAAGSNPDHFSFDGSNDYIELDYIHPTLSETTASFWIKFADVTPSQNDYFASSTASGGSNANNNFHLGLMADGRLYAEYGSQWNYLTASASESDLTANTWTMLSFVWSDSSIKYYKNGELKTTTTGFSNIGTTNNNVKLHLGRMGAYPAYYVDMDLGQFKIYDKELTADELVAEFNKHKSDYGL